MLECIKVTINRNTVYTYTTGDSGRILSCNLSGEGGLQERNDKAKKEFITKSNITESVKVDRDFKYISRKLYFSNNMVIKKHIFGVEKEFYPCTYT